MLLTLSSDLNVDISKDGLGSSKMFRFYYQNSFRGIRKVAKIWSNRRQMLPSLEQGRKRAHSGSIISKASFWYGSMQLLNQRNYYQFIHCHSKRISLGDALGRWNFSFTSDKWSNSSTKAGQSIEILWSTALRLMELKVSEASTKRAASQSAGWNISCMAWIAASDPAACPAKVCKGPAVADTTNLVTHRALPFRYI